MLNSVRGELSAVDTTAERMQMGTVGGDHLVTKTLSSTQVTGLVDDTDPSITYFGKGGYGTSAVNFSNGSGRIMSSRGTYCILGGLAGTGTPGAAVQYTFTGTKIAVLCDSTPDSGAMDVYIDGVLTPGRLSSTQILFTPSGTPNTPAISATDTSIKLAGAPSFSISGTVLIGSELITYTGITGNTLTGCTRGTGGTTAVAHYTYETVYSWGSSIDLATSGENNYNKKITYYNNQLSSGTHTIQVVAKTGNSGNARVYFEGFVVGSLIGAQSLNYHTETVTVVVTTDGNGFCEVGELVSQNNDEGLIGVIGYTQTNAESTGTTTVAKLLWKYKSGTDSNPTIYFVNGPISASLSVVITLAFIGVST